MKLDLSLLKGKSISIDEMNFYNPIVKIKQNKKDDVLLIFKNGFKLEINFDFFIHCGIIGHKPNHLVFVFKGSHYINPFVPFTLFTNFGFPFELTEEVMKKDLDKKGFDLLMKLHKEKSKGTFHGETWV